MADLSESFSSVILYWAVFLPATYSVSLPLSRAFEGECDRWGLLQVGVCMP